MTPDRPTSIDWLDLRRAPAFARATGRLGMTGLADAMRLRAADGIDTLVLLVEDHELAEANATDLEVRLGREGIQVQRHPIQDMGIPSDPITFRTLLHEITDQIERGRSVVVACLGGYGRTGTTVACLLVDAGLTADQAIQEVRATRPGTIENEQQEAFIRRS